MGTTVYRATKAQAIADELADIAQRSEVLAHRVLGSRLWVLAQVKQGVQAGQRWIGLSLIHTRGPEVTVKRMDESCGPYFYDCPLQFLARASEPQGPYAGAWRNQVRAFHASRIEALRRREHLQPGARVRYGGSVYQLLRPLGRRGWAVKREHDGMSMRMTARQIDQVTPAASETEPSIPPEGP